MVQVLKLSSLWFQNSDKNYNFRISISWCGENNFEKVKEEIQNIINTNQKKKLFNIRPYNFPKRLWSYC